MVVDKNKRIFERFSVSLPIKFKDSSLSDASMCNVSAQGISVVVGQLPDKNQPLLMDVIMPDSIEPMSLSGRMVWVKKQMGQLWSIGIKFNEINLLRSSRLMKYAKTHAMT